MNTETEPESVTLKARDLKPYHYGVWSSIEGGKPFSNTICSIRWSEDGEHLWFMLESHNFYKVAPDEDIEVIPERSPHSQRTRDKDAAGYAALNHASTMIERGLHRTEDYPLGFNVWEREK